MPLIHSLEPLAVGGSRRDQGRVRESLLGFKRPCNPFPYWRWISCCLRRGLFMDELNTYAVTGKKAEWIKALVCHCSCLILAKWKHRWGGKKNREGFRLSIFRQKVWITKTGQTQKNTRELVGVGMVKTNKASLVILIVLSHLKVTFLFLLFQQKKSVCMNVTDKNERK